MSKLLGGLFSRPSGKTSGIVFGAANTRRGKKVTSRQLVVPANPRTPAQLLQRKKFISTSEILLNFPPQITAFDWNKKIGGLAGVSALTSIFLRNMDGANEIITAPSPVSLGNLHFPDTFAAELNVAGTELALTWSDENGFNGAAGDTYVAMVIQNDGNESSPSERQVHIETGTFTRGDGGFTFTGLTGLGSGSLVGLYFRGASAGDYPGLMSRCHWVIATDA